jgi:L-lactate dehydrogenase complex protein LldE
LENNLNLKKILKRVKVALFIPCYIDQFYPNVAKASLEVLEYLGCEVDFPLNQTCCGQPMANSGFAHLSKDCDQNFKNNFDAYEYVVCPSGSCALHAKEHIHGKAKIYELIEFIYDVLGKKSWAGEFHATVGYHVSCHGQRGLMLSQMSELNAVKFSKPHDLLKGISGLSLVELKRPDECCGFGGTFCVTEEAVSVRMGKDRIQDHINAGAEYILGGDSSCLMHLEGIIKKENKNLKIMHIAELLAKSVHIHEPIS